MKAFKIFVPMDGSRGAVKMDYQGNVALDLKADTSWSPNSDIMADSHITLNLGDIRPTGDLHRKMYIVTIEEIRMPADLHQREFFTQIIREREEKELQDSGISPSITRRLKNVS